MATTALLSTVVTGAVLLAIVAVVLRLRHWEHPAASVDAVETGTVGRRLNGPLGWSVAFFVVTLAVVGLAIGYASGEPVAGLDPAAIGLAIAVVLGTVFTVAVVVGVYGAAKSRGLNNAQAAGLGSVLLATLVLLAIVVQLFVGG